MTDTATPKRKSAKRTAKRRYRLHWSSGHAPKPSLKWTIYDWTLICPVAYSETRVGGRRLCAFLNEGLVDGN